MTPDDARFYLANARNFFLCIFVIGGIAAMLLPGAVFFGLSYGTRWFKRKMLSYAHLVQFYAWRVTFYTNRASRTVVDPILYVGGWAARLRFYASQVERWVRQKED